VVQLIAEAEFQFGVNPPLDLLVSLDRCSLSDRERKVTVSELNGRAVQGEEVAANDRLVGREEAEAVSDFLRRLNDRATEEILVSFETLVESFRLKRPCACFALGFGVAGGTEAAKWAARSDEGTPAVLGENYAFDAE
jgi:hypothetical protein